jgi:hypothetical protein
VVPETLTLRARGSTGPIPEREVGPEASGPIRLVQSYGPMAQLLSTWLDLTTRVSVLAQQEWVPQL